jgi:hypothetical protein
VPELRVSDLAFAHVGARLVVDCPSDVGNRPYAGVLFDVVHRPGGPSWLSFRVDGAPVVLVVDDPSATGVVVVAEEPVAVPGQVSRSGEPLRQHSQ